MYCLQNRNSLGVLLFVVSIPRARNGINQEQEIRPRRWFRRQNSRQMSTASDNHYNGEIEYAAALAAAAFAISTLDLATPYEDSQNVEGIGPSLDRIKSQNEKIDQTAKPYNESESSSDDEKTQKLGPGRANSLKPASDAEIEMPEKIIHPVPSTRRRPTFALSSNDFEEIGNMKPKLDTRKPHFSPAPPSVPSTRRKPTFSLSSNDFEEIGTMKPKFDTRKPSFPPPPPPPPPPVPSTRWRPTFSLGSKDFEDNDSQNPPFLPPPAPSIPPPFSRPVSRPIEAQIPRFQESEADAWERAELDKIKKRYEELNLTIHEWEQKRKKKAKGKLDKTEGDSGRKRAKALQAYQEDIERIRQITEGARAQAKEKQRNEELKVRAKADKYRLTGEPPATCLCF